MRTIAASILSADFGRLADEVRAVAAAGADWIHVDVMDGSFVPPITIGPRVVEALRRATALPLDVHLMIQHPERQVAEFVRAGWRYWHQPRRFLAGRGEPTIGYVVLADAQRPNITRASEALPSEGALLWDV